MYSKSRETLFSATVFRSKKKNQFDGVKSPKRGKPFSGAATVTFAAEHGENGKFNAGFRLGKCIKVDKGTIAKGVKTVQVR